MSASVETSAVQDWVKDRPASAHWDELPTDGSHAWLGLILLLASSVVAVRGLCWVAATAIHLLH